MGVRTQQVASPARLLYSEPQLFACDIRRALLFFVEKLGFKIAFEYGQPTHYAQVARDGARLNIRHAELPAFDAEFRRMEIDALSATIIVDRPEALFAELSQRGADFHQPLRREEWGAQTFIVRDPDGNLLCFVGA